MAARRPSLMARLTSLRDRARDSFRRARASSTRRRALSAAGVRKLGPRLYHAAADDPAGAVAAVREHWGEARMFVVPCKGQAGRAAHEGAGGAEVVDGPLSMETAARLAEAVAAWWGGGGERAAVLCCPDEAAARLAACVLHYAGAPVPSLGGKAPPSHRRFVDDFCAVVREGDASAALPPPRLRMTALRVEGLPRASRMGVRPVVTVMQGNRFLYTTMQNGGGPRAMQWLQPGEEPLEVPIGAEFAGDAVLRVYHQPQYVSADNPRRLLFLAVISTAVAAAKAARGGRMAVTLARGDTDATAGDRAYTSAFLTEALFEAPPPEEEEVAEEREQAAEDEEGVAGGEEGGERQAAAAAAAEPLRAPSDPVLALPDMGGDEEGDNAAAAAAPAPAPAIARSSSPQRTGAMSAPMRAREAPWQTLPPLRLGGERRTSERRGGGGGDGDGDEESKAAEPDRLAVGSAVNARWTDRRWYPAVVTTAHRDGTFTVTYTQDGIVQRVRRSGIEPLARDGNAAAADEVSRDELLARAMQAQYDREARALAARRAGGTPPSAGRRGSPRPELRRNVSSPTPRGARSVPRQRLQQQRQRSSSILQMLASADGGERAGAGASGTPPARSASLVDEMLALEADYDEADARRASPVPPPPRAISIDELLARELQAQWDAGDDDDGGGGDAGGSGSVPAALFRRAAPVRVSANPARRRFGGGYARRRGASSRQIGELPEFPVAAGSKYLEDNCPVCRERFQAGETIRLLPCLHVFHQGCVDQWLVLNLTCPTCTRRIDS